MLTIKILSDLIADYKLSASFFSEKSGISFNRLYNKIRKQLELDVQESMALTAVIAEMRDAFDEALKNKSAAK